MKQLSTLAIALFIFNTSFAQDTETKEKGEREPVITKKVEDGFFTLVEDMPSYPGGDDGLMAWIVNELQYPPRAVKKKIEGTVYVSYVVGKGGYVENVKVVRGVHPLLDEEAIRVIQGIQGFKPGYQKGKPVPVQFTIPITFKL